MSETATDQAARAGRNQALFREINERVQELNERLHEGNLPQQAWICECASLTCLERLAMSFAEYGEVRAHGLRFAVAPAAKHFFAEAEEVVVRGDRFWVVEKYGEAAEAAGTERIDA